ncbi:hypothetical protein L9F63_004399, partial [Diploptera punctata]
PNRRYPRSIFLIIATEFCERFSFCGLRTILSLYLRNSLLFHENDATIIYHVFISLCYFVPIFGAILADSFLGRYRTILYFSCIYAVGNILMCVAAAPPISLSPVFCTIFGLILIAIGTGGIKPCVAAFGGDQFHLPIQETLLNQFFSIFYFTLNFGGLVGMVITPILRKKYSCFGDDTCYALGFGFPAVLMIMALLLFVLGKQIYRMKAPQENVAVRFLQCASYALIMKCRSKGVRNDHWLDYARGRYNAKIISDMKIVLAILCLFIPLPLFWSLFDQQGSRWTFQASRMDGQVFNTELLPDQMQVINPAIVLVLIPLFDKYIYPLTDRFHFMASPLRKMVLGGILAGLAFVASAVLEMKLEETYPVLPCKGEAHLNFVNTLPCRIGIINRMNNLQNINSTDNYVFYDIPVDTVIVTTVGDKLNALWSEPEQLKKSLSGKPKFRVIFCRDKHYHKNSAVLLENEYGMLNITFTSERVVGVSKYVELDPGEYKYSVFLKSKPEYREDVSLELGAVYSLVLLEQKGKITFSKVYTMTPANRIHMLWLIPQYLLISIAEVMFGISGLQFSFVQAPKSLKTVTIAAWYLSVSIGNLMVIIITQANLFRSQVARRARREFNVALQPSTVGKWRKRLLETGRMQKIKPLGRPRISTNAETVKIIAETFDASSQKSTRQAAG